jgi:hypothetical protein
VNVVFVQQQHWRRFVLCHSKALLPLGSELMHSKLLNMYTVHCGDVQALRRETALKDSLLVPAMHLL